MSDNAQKIIDAILERLHDFARTETVVGQPVNIGEVVILPVIKIAVGFGAGGGEGGTDAKDGKGGGSAGGGGASINPVGFLVWDGKGVEFIRVSGRGKIEGLIESVPELLDKLGLRKKEKREKGKKHRPQRESDEADDGE